MWSWRCYRTGEGVPRRARGHSCTRVADRSLPEPREHPLDLPARPASPHRPLSGRRCAPRRLRRSGPRASRRRAGQSPTTSTSSSRRARLPLRRVRPAGDGRARGGRALATAGRPSAWGWRSPTRRHARPRSGAPASHTVRLRHRVGARAREHPLARPATAAAWTAVAHGG